MIENEQYLRKEADPLEIVEKWGWKYHHMGIPTKEERPNEKYIPNLKFYVSGFDKSPYGVEWMRFEEDSPVHPLVQSVPHVAFEVQNIEWELSYRKFTVLTPPNPPSEGIRVAMIEHNGAPIELIEFEKKPKS